MIKNYKYYSCNFHLYICLLVYSLLFIICVPVIAQTDDEIYFINSYKYNIDGKTREYAVDYRAAIITGEEITGYSNLENFIQGKTQLLLNERVFESVNIDYTIGDMDDSGKYPVDLIIHIKDTWNFIALPYPKYDSNTGFSLTIKARDYNFLGTMSPLRIDAGYERNNNGKNFFNLMLDTDIPVYLFGLIWNIDFDHSIVYRPDLDYPLYYRNTTGLSLEVPVRRSTITVGFSEILTVNDEKPGVYMTSKPYISWRIPTGLIMSDFGELSYSPSISVSFNHEFPDWPLADSLIGPFLNFSHSLGFGRVNWIGNFRKGFSFNIYNSFKYNFFNAQNDLNPMSGDLHITGTAHFAIKDFSGVSVRIMYRYFFFDGFDSSAGSILRGIRDSSVKADKMLSLNIDASVRALKFRPSEWFNNSSFWRIFDFDFHIGPVIDAALYNDPYNPVTFAFNDLLLTAGIEAVIFPLRWRSIFLRVSFGKNFSIADLNDSYELFIGMEFHH